MTTLARSQEWIFNFLKLIGAEKDTAASNIAVVGQAELKISQQFVRTPRRELETETLLMPESLPISTHSVLQELMSDIATNVQLVPAQELSDEEYTLAQGVLISDRLELRPIATFEIEIEIEVVGTNKRPQLKDSDFEMGLNGDANWL
jgi:hypothetical protein